MTYDTTDARGRYYFRYRDVGIKLVPKCGSTTIRGALQLTTDISEDGYLSQKEHVTVIRNPLVRLLSFCRSTPIQRPGNNQSKRMTKKYSMPESPTREEFLDVVLNTPDRERDWHMQSFSRQCPHMKDSTVIPIECWERDRGAFGFPPLPEKKENAALPDNAERVGEWTPEEIDRILADPDYHQDYQVWTDAVASSPGWFHHFFGSKL